MVRCALTFAVFCSILVSRPNLIVVAQQTTTSAPQDPIVGVWALDTLSGEKMEYVITVYPNGTTKNRMLGEEFEGTWKRLKNGRYVIEPGREDDYAILRSGRLEEWDKIGFIRSLKRVSPRQTSTRPTRHQADSAWREAQGWAYANFTQGMWWKASTLREFVQHMGRYHIIPANLPHYKAYYFTQADLTILVDEERGVAMKLREGRAAQ